MELNHETIKRIAELSRLKLSQKEEEQYLQDLEKILQAFSSLSQVCLPSELENDSTTNIALKNDRMMYESCSKMQKDLVNNSLASQIFLVQAPEREGLFIRVPGVLNSTT